MCHFIIQSEIKQKPSLLSHTRFLAFYISHMYSVFALMGSVDCLFFVISQSDYRYFVVVFFFTTLNCKPLYPTDHLLGDRRIWYHKFLYSNFKGEVHVQCSYSIIIFNVLSLHCMHWYMSDCILACGITFNLPSYTWISFEIICALVFFPSAY